LLSLIKNLKNSLLFLSGVIPLIFTPTSVFSSEGHEAAHEHTLGWWQILVQSDLLNVIILAIAMIYLGNKFMPKILDQRKSQISKELEDAKNTRLKAEGELEQVRHKTKNILKEIEQIKEEAKVSATTIKKQMEEETEKEIERLKEKVKKEIASSKDEAVESIRKSASTTAIKLAEEALTQISKNKEVQEKLLSDFLSEVKTPNSN